MAQSSDSHTLTVFVDGLKPSSLQYMDFVSTFYSERIRTELGYSPTCDGSMYTGVYPNKHHCWFIWQRDPSDSPFGYIDRLGLQRLPHNVYSKYAMYKTGLTLNQNKSQVPGFTIFFDTPVRHWGQFKPCVDGKWTQDDLLPYPTIFEILRDRQVPYQAIGDDAQDLAKSSLAVKEAEVDFDASWTYYYIADVDPLSHKYGQESDETIAKIRDVDDIIREKYSEFEQRYGENFDFLLFSDHGHALVDEHIPLPDIFRREGYDIHDYVHFIDSNFARFWPRSPSERNEIQSALSPIDKYGMYLTEEHRRKYNVDMPDNRYGKLIFYLDLPHTFEMPTFSALGREMSYPPVSMHGYLPDHTSMDGVLVSNRPIQKNNPELVDIPPTMLKSIGQSVPEYMDGSEVL